MKRSHNIFRVVAGATHALCAVLLLSACGGGGGGSTVVQDGNNAPVARAGVDITVYEGSSVALDAAKSSDTDGDALSYVWRQVSGTPSINLTAANYSRLDFIAPQVDADADFVFEVAVNDGKSSAPSRDEIRVRVLSISQTGNRQAVLSSQVSQSRLDNGSGGKPAEPNIVKVGFTYATEPANTLTNGLVLKLHWDSSRLTFNTLNDVLTVNHLGVGPVTDDVDDADHNPATDKYVAVSWVDLANSQWPAQTSLPASLMTAVFNAVSGVSATTTQINLTGTFTSPGFTFYTQTVNVEL